MNSEEMTMDNLSLPIFPLPVFLLPEGKMRLRVFEKKYIRLISIASARGGFIMKPRTDVTVDNFKVGRYEEDNNGVVSSIAFGSLVEIHDFNQGEDGILEVDIYCRALVEISTIDTQNELQFSSITLLPHWSDVSKTNNTHISELAYSLNDIIKGDTMLRSLYQDMPLTNETWVIARWLELLPINLKMKKTFISTHGFNHAKDLVESIIYK